MALILDDGTINVEQMNELYEVISKTLNKVVTPENVRNKLKWQPLKFYDFTNMTIKNDDEAQFLELKFKTETRIENISGFINFVQDKQNENRLNLNENPAVSRIKNRTEMILDEVLDDTPFLKEHGVYFTYEVEVDYKDKKVLLDETLEIYLTVCINQL